MQVLKVLCVEAIIYSVIRKFGIVLGISGKHSRAKVWMEKNPQDKVGEIPPPPRVGWGDFPLLRLGGIPPSPQDENY